NTFKETLGIALAIFGFQLCYRAVSDYCRFGNLLGSRFVEAGNKTENEGSPADFAVTTIARSFDHITIRFGNQERQFSNLALFVAGLAVGVFSSALGVGGGFLLVPIFAIGWRLPIYVMVAATIPYTLALSLAGIFAFNIILPLAGTPAIAPEWSWGLFCAAGGAFGSWVASKTQIYMPEHFLGFMLGAVTSVVGCLYVLSTMVSLPFAL
ncbi:MAG: sulfite exporter TauE/SafE family protein, partial [Candidatus Acidiferrales bacterium]